MIIIIFGNELPGLARYKTLFEHLVVAELWGQFKLKHAAIIEGTPAVLEAIERIAMAAGCNVIKPAEPVDDLQKGENHADPN